MISYNPSADVSPSIESSSQIEQLYTFAEIAAMLKWSYEGVRTYFKDQQGVLVRFVPKRYRRPYKRYFVPKSVLEREWAKMASFNVRGAK